MTGHGKVRASSVLAQRSVRDALRKDKPFRAEVPVVAPKKKKLDIHVSYAAPPPGFVFLPLGTPELADLCKEVSSQQGIPINIVHAKPASKSVMDPGKVSHHIQRIGYHFRADVVDQACRHLKYIKVDGKFVSEADLQKLQHASVIAKAMQKVGMKANIDLGNKESSQQVAAVIKELFPSIPDKDLDEVVRHAWEKGSARVGTIEEIDLSRRVQLAVIARIRHEYTDYDRLLKAFGWQAARQEVEPECLKKLIEWRGEQGEGEDSGLEEIVRETIVNDADAPRLADSLHATPTGDASDTSVEIVHRPALAHDLRAESPLEQRHAYVQGRPAHRSFTERNDIARAKIDAMRGQMRAQALRPAEPPTRIKVDDNNPPDEIIVDGVRMRRAPNPHPYATSGQRPFAPTQAPYSQPQLLQNAQYAQPVPYQQQSAYTQPQTYQQPAYTQPRTQVQPAYVPTQMYAQPAYTQPQAYAQSQAFTQPQTYAQPQQQAQPYTQGQLQPYLQRIQSISRPQDVPVHSIESAQATQDHRQTASSAMTTRSEAFSPRHGEPAYLQYRQLQAGIQQQQVSPQKFAQTWPPPAATTMNYQALPAQYHPLPQKPMTSVPAQTGSTPQYLPQYPSLPRHGAPAPVQPAYQSTVPPVQPPLQPWYGR